jgi:uncharacterized repeat protein (TIGR03803 family)
MLAAPAAQAQTFTVIHTFTGLEGAGPSAGLTMDPAGNLYGTTGGGGTARQGTVFKLTAKNSGWIFSSLYSFQGGTDGANPEARVVIGPDGSLYGTTQQGGDPDCLYGQGCGTIFNLRPPLTPCRSILCPWIETVLHRFTVDDGGPGGDLIFDSQGNLYGTTSAGVYQLTRSNGGWTFSVIYQSDAGGRYGVIFDHAGNLYGTTFATLMDTVYELTPSPSGWVETVLHTLNNGTDGSFPAGLIFDPAGNLYGGDFDGGPNNGGTVFELSPSSGGWTYTMLRAFTGNGSGGPCCGSLVMDPGGSLFGTTQGNGAYGYGSLFKLTPSGGGWTYDDLHDFPLIGSDGCDPNNGLVLDRSGNLYGTAAASGANVKGTVWKITP